MDVYRIRLFGVARGSEALFQKTAACSNYATYMRVWGVAGEVYAI